MPDTITLPPDSHQLLLKAACCSNQVGLKAWQEWQGQVDIEQLDSESYRLLPLLYKNLATNQIQSHEMTRLQGVYRRHWYSNQLRIRELTDILQAFETANIRCCVAGDAALLPYYGSDLGMRPIDQLDVVVAPQDGLKAIQVLARLNWHARVELTDSFMALHSKIGLWNASHQLLHLHWRMFGSDVSAAQDDGFWQTAAVVSLNQNSIRTLNPIAQILHICTRITAADGAIAPLWIADFAKVVSFNPSENFWESLIQAASKARLMLPLRQLINAGATILEPLPASHINRIQSVPLSPLEWLEQQFGGVLGRSPLSRYFQYLRQADSSQGGANPSVMSLLHYYQQSWGLKQPWEVPLHGVVRLVRFAWSVRSLKVKS
ncbi:nucleotidyltransferase family protein [Oscillatoria sp. FACHB-1407]|uniref:nucleotidyltransferase family protein n=1 Tax=Oscillatoria sp. FACHB-1407 TaxID=2692847 RepID=UPI001686426C|nr:nucleotidyltransferase family protein [Oscillatoria sp. FACHB-1407]MBD2459424.1 nucleotidyltransferase family protein [Oscillatoria sp. FACHB-1407]